jgi:hypothetical protein
MLVIATSSTSTRAHARPKTRVGVFEHRRAARVRARAAASRETRWGNCGEVQRSAAGLSQYLSPEPLLQSPSYLKGMAEKGMSVPTYAYAANNPIKYTDPDGRCIFTGFDTLVCISAADAALIAAAAVGITAAGATVVANSQSSSTDAPVCGPLTLSETQAKCQKEYEEGRRACEDSLRSRGLGTLVSTYVCNVCLASQRSICLTGMPDPAAEAICWALASKHGGFPFD